MKSISKNKRNPPYLLFFIIIAAVIGLSVLITSHSFSRGDAYYSLLQKYYALGNTGNWSEADQIAKKLDPADIATYRSVHHPDELKKKINSLVLQPKKTAEDWLELARIQSILGKKDDAFQSITQAHRLDPIRDDITQLYYQLQK